MYHKINHLQTMETTLLKKIEKVINAEMQKRGIDSVMELSLDGKKIIGEAGSFNTFPVIFESLRPVLDFLVTEVVDSTHYNFYARLQVRYIHFDGGSNSVDLFNVSGIVGPEDRCSSVRISY